MSSFHVGFRDAGALATRYLPTQPQAFSVDKYYNIYFWFFFGSDKKLYKYWALIFCYKLGMD